MVGRLPGGTAEQVREQANRVRQKFASAFVCFVWEDDGKVPVLAALSPDLVKKGHKAGDIVKKVAAVMGGSGGGQAGHGPGRREGREQDRRGGGGGESHLR